MITPARRISNVKQYYFARKLKEIRAMDAADQIKVMNLGIGSPDLPAPESAVASMKDALSLDEVSKYQPYVGTPKLREAFTNWYRRHFNVHLDADWHILPLMGSKEGIMGVSMAYLDQGDEVLVPDPGYPAYKACAEIAGATVRTFSLRADNGYLPDLEAIESEDLTRVKLIWINYPNMPTGAVATKEFFNAIRAFGEKHKVLICHDNPYSFILNSDPISALPSEIHSPYILELASLSKNYHMAGWRVGALVAHPTVIEHVLRFKSNMDSGMFLGIQHAAVAALEANDQWFDAINEHYRRRKELATELFSQIGCKVEASDAGMFVWAKVPAGHTGESLSDDLLYNAKVFITPGMIFGNQGTNYLRISLCSKEGVFEEAMQRIRENITDI